MDRDEDFSAYVGLRWSQLVRAARLLGCSEAEAEDIVQSALIRCYKAWGRVTAADQPEAYVYRAVVNELKTSKRRRWWGEQPSSDAMADVSTPDQSTTVDARESVAAAIKTLPTDQQTAVVLRYYADLSERDAAQALGIPVGTLKSRTSRALQALSALLDDHAAGSSAQGDEAR